MNYLKKWWAKKKAARENEIKEMIRGEFDVVEKSGVLFLTHNGVAFEQIPAEAPAAEVATMLNGVRTVAQTYRQLC